MMFAQQPQPDPQPETQFEDQRAPETPKAVNQQLLNDVLGETLARHREDGSKLIDALVRLRQTKTDQPCDESLFIEIAEQVLQYRLGEQCRRLPREAFEEVGRAFWNSDPSRKRIQQFWSNLGNDN
ncbi:hypothetical protein [Rhodopirellula sp. MGV]|uniref:hypothetical protein n=1 Tax=Rhodopirellula sp. MGV TaxID=2023130 RepID=UPI000B965310|nr:hypothetical protein [Rhodopirellula sp. MGV]OYP35470.1 hypothetical protein CGZ80_11550 [Rhodopirellula sp. MGV]PNY33911.1 hypothetical protein C2E31_26180 [Rhodopirellula baltica]